MLVSASTADDGAVYKLTDDLAIIQSVDFFTPVVDDPYWFGSIAVANSISDIYAMGGRPIIGLNIVCYPDSGVPEDSLAEIMRGGGDKAREAGVSIVGGHTIVDEEPKFGLAITGLIHPDRIVRNVGARPGDALILTKPIGVGIITTAIKQGIASEPATQLVTRQMATLNEAACHAMVEIGVHAATDITGYGLLGHLFELTSASKVGAELSLAAIPVIEAAWQYVRQGAVPAGTHRNWNYLENVRSGVRWHADLTEEQKIVLCDAQTSGGLVIAVAPKRRDDLVEALKRHNVATVAEIGRINDDSNGVITVVP